MIRRIMVAAGAALAVALIQPSGAAHAQADRPAAGGEAGSGAGAAAPAILTPRIIVVDFQGVMRESSAARTIQQQINGLRTSYQEEFGAIEERLRNAEAQLTQARETLPPDEFIERRRAFEQQVTEAQREAQARRARLDQALDQAMDRVRSALLEVIARIAQDRGVNIVLAKQQVILTDRSLDFTEQALARLNQVLPSVTVVLPQQ